MSKATQAVQSASRTTSKGAYTVCMIELLPADGSGVEASRLVPQPGRYDTIAEATQAAIAKLRANTNPRIVGFSWRNASDVDTHREHLAHRAKAKRREVQPCK